MYIFLHFPVQAATFAMTIQQLCKLKYKGWVEAKKSICWTSLFHPRDYLLVVQFAFSVTYKET